MKLFHIAQIALPIFYVFLAYYIYRKRGKKDLVLVLLFLIATVFLFARLFAYGFNDF